MTRTGRLRQERGLLFQALGPYERVGISLIEVYEMVGKSVISVGKKAQKSYTRGILWLSKSRENFLVLWSIDI